MDLSDPTTFSGMYERHARSVYSAAYRILGNATQAQDVSQDVFLKVWRRPAAFDARRGELGSYLRLMARSRALDLWREQQAAGRASDRMKVVAGAADERAADERPAAMAEREERRGVVRDMLRTLPDTQREAVLLAHWGGMTADEIAHRSGVPLGTAKSRIRLGLAKLRTEFGEPLLAAEAA